MVCSSFLFEVCWHHPMIFRFSSSHSLHHFSPSRSLIHMRIFTHFHDTYYTNGTSFSWYDGYNRCIMMLLLFETIESLHFKVPALPKISLNLESFKKFTAVRSIQNMLGTVHPSSNPTLFPWKIWTKAFDVGRCCRQYEKIFMCKMWKKMTYNLKILRNWRS